MSKLPPIRINTLVDWTSVMAVLGIDIPSSILPCTVRCPLCGSTQLTVYQDTIDGGQWHYCSGCKSSGDMIQLLRRVLKTTPKAAFYHFASAAAPEMVAQQLTDEHFEQYGADYTTYRDNVTQFWNEASGKFVSSTFLRQLRLHLGIENNVSAEDWKKTTGQFLGSATREEVDRCVNRLMNHSLFTGFGYDARHWKEVTVMPFWDLPGRISAFLFCRDNNGEEKPFKYWSIARERHNAFSNNGVAMLPALHEPRGEFDDTAFVFLDPLLAIRTHIRHFESHLYTLPLVAVWPAASTAPYLREHSAKRDLVFWAHKPDADLFRHAKAANGRVCYWEGSREEVIYFLRRMNSVQWLHKLSKEAIRWDTALEKLLVNKSLIEVEALLAQLDWDDGELQAFIDGCTTDVGTRLKTIYKERYHNKTVVVNGQAIRDTPQGWFSLKSGEVVSDAKFIINHAVHYQNGLIQYRGHIHFNGQQIAFTAPAEEFEGRPLAWIRSYLIKTGVGVCSYVTQWQKQAMMVATRFHTPKVMQGVDTYGFDPTLSAFVLPTYIIEAGGEVRTHELPVLDTLQAIRLPKPQALSVEDREFLSSNDPAAELTWAVALCVLHNVLAPVYNYKPVGIGVTGRIGVAVEKLAIQAGCELAHVPKLDPRHIDVPTVVKQEASVRWPLFFAEPVSSPDWLQKPHNSFLPMDWYTAQLLCIEDDQWLTLDGESVEVTDAVVHMAGTIVGAFLQELMRARLALAYPMIERHPLHVITDNVAEWFDKTGDTTGALCRGERLIWTKHCASVSDLFFTVAARLFDEGHLQFARAEFFTEGTDLLKTPTIVYIDKNEGLIWLPKMGINKALVAVSKIQLDQGVVSRALVSEHHLVDERDIQGVPGWLISEKTWDLHLKRWRRRRSGMLGVAQ